MYGNWKGLQEFTTVFLMLWSQLPGSDFFPPFSDYLPSRVPFIYLSSASHGLRGVRQRLPPRCLPFLL